MDNRERLLKDAELGRECETTLAVLETYLKAERERIFNELLAVSCDIQASVAEYRALFRFVNAMMCGVRTGQAALRQLKEENIADE